MIASDTTYTEHARRNWTHTHHGFRVCGYERAWPNAYVEDRFELLSAALECARLAQLNYIRVDAIEKDARGVEVLEPIKFDGADA